ncbi:hypothetical protein BDR22DRAFT_907498 [Usnea florida]
MSAPLGPPPVGGDQDRGSDLMAMLWTECVLAMIIVALRFYARIKMRNLGADDWMMLITVVLFLIMTCFTTHLASIGGCRHLYYLTPEQALKAVKWTWISEPWGVFLFATGKAAVAILILRIMGRTSFWRKWILYALVVSLFITCSLCCIFIFVECDPPRALWTPGLTAHCWNPSVQENFNYFLSALSIFADVVLALLPITIFYRLQMTFARRVALCCLLGLGLVAALFCGIKTRYLVDLTERSDLTWETYDIEAFTGAEAFVMIICGNIPPLKPLWDRFVTKKLDSNYTPIEYNKETYHSKLPSTAKTSSNDSPPLNEPVIKTVTDIDVVRSTNMV